MLRGQSANVLTYQATGQELNCCLCNQTVKLNVYVYIYIYIYVLVIYKNLQRLQDDWSSADVSHCATQQCKN